MVSEEAVDSIPVGVGDLLAGKYRVEKILGAGGMGVVVSARHVDLGELFAIKFVRDSGAGSEELVERFLREARAVVRLKSKHVVRVHDVGRLESGAPYMVMEHLEGADLDQMLDAGRLPPVSDCVDLVLQALDAMAEAHCRGIVHRDLKPANLFVTMDPDGNKCVKVLDFGISKLIEGAGESMRMTGTNTVMGSPYYMSPEQIMSTRDVDERTDVWSLGVVLYELLTGKVPFAGKNIGEQCALLLRTTPPAPSAIAPRSIPPGLDEVVMRALSAEPDHRGPDVSVLARGLAPFGGPDAAQSLQRIERTLAHRGRGTLPSLNELPSQTAAEVPDELARMLVQADAIPNPRSRDRDVDQTGPTVASTKRSAQAPAGMMSDDSTRRLARSIQIEEAAALEGGGGPSMSQSTRASWGTSHKLEPKRPSKTRLVLAAALSVAVGAGVALVILTRAAGGPDVQSAAQDDGQPAEPLVATEQIAAADEPAEAAPQPSEHESDDAAAAAPSVAVSASATSASASASPATVSTAPPKAGAPSPRPAVRPAAPLPPPKAAPSPTPAPKPNGSDPFGDGRM